MTSVIRYLYLPFIFWVAGAGVITLSNNQAEANPQDEIVSKLDSLFSSWDSPDTPGCAVGVSKKGIPVISRAYGMADLEHMVPNTPFTIFEAGSVSKQFVTASVILLALEGKLSLGDDIREFIPELPDYGETITLRHLMNHTSGLRDWGSVAEISGWGRSQRVHDHSHVLDILSRQTHLNFPPGERYSYSNSGYNLLAMVVEQVSGSSFAEYSSGRIFERLRMTNTQWRDDYRKIVKGRSSAYSGREGAEVFTINRPIEHVHGNGGLLTTVGDLLKWNHALYSGYFGEEFAQEMLQQGVLNNGRTIPYASGLRIDRDHGQEQIVHTGATSGYRAYLSWFPGQELSVALLCNVTGVNSGSMGSAVSRLFFDGDTTEREDGDETGMTPGEGNLQNKTGIWADEHNHRPVEITLQNESALTIDGGPELIPLSESEYRVGASGQEVFQFSPTDKGDRPLIQVVREGYPEEVLKPVQPFHPESAALEDFTGRFESRDAETELLIKRENEEKLIVHRRPDDTFELQPVYEDAFHARGFGLIRFFRNDSGEIIEFACSSGRVYDIRFYRR